MIVTLSHDATPEAAEARVEAALARSGRATVLLNGFPHTAWAVIARRLPASVHAAHLTPNVVVLSVGPAAAPRSDRLDPFVHGRLYHLGGLAPKGLENSHAGVKAAVRGGFARIDFDVSRTRDGVLVAYHPGTIRGVDASRLTLAELQAHATAGGHRIWTATELTNYATAHGLLVELEAKVPDLTAAELAAFRDTLHSPHMTQWKALPKNASSLVGAHLAGWPTILLGRGHAFGARIRAAADYVRGRATFRGRP